jgi:hypothetical protein
MDSVTIIEKRLKQRRKGSRLYYILFGKDWTDWFNRWN